MFGYLKKKKLDNVLNVNLLGGIKNRKNRLGCVN